MTPEVFKSHADALTEWAQAYESEPQSGAAGIAFLMRRTAKLLTGMANNESVTFEPMARVPDLDAVRDDVADVEC